MYYPIIILTVFFVGIPYLFLMKKETRKLCDSLWWLANNKGKRLPFSTTSEYGAGKGLIYCPHPFTNWSLNPSYRNRFDEAEHTVEGFRRTGEERSIMKLAGDSSGSYRIACVGASTTYCTDVERYSDTWPALLKEKLKSHNVSVFNFGVAHWSTIQSFIRCVTWFPVIRPDLVIFYQAKNDLNILTNMMDNEKYPYPDYQNVMRQFSQALDPGFPKPLLFIPFFTMLAVRKLKRLGFFRLYKVMPDLRRIPKFVNDDVINGTVFRTETLIKICKAINCMVLYVPEIVREGEYREVLYNRIYNRISRVVSSYDNTCLFEMRGLMPETDEFFTDKMHLNNKGSAMFADKIAEGVKKIMAEGIINKEISKNGVKSL